MKKLSIKNLKASVEEKQILHGLDLEVKKGELHAIMGPNGSGKSTLAKVLAGHPDYEGVGSVKLDKTEILDLEPEERARLGLFLAFQYPVEVPGVKAELFLREAWRQRFPEKNKSALEFRRYLQQLAEELGVKEELIYRSLNENLSGGEKKRLEILQMAVLEPEFAILDETDSGLDIDAIRAVAAGVKKIIKQHQTGVIVITHYQRILEYLQPDFVHVVVEGKVVESGGSEIVARLEEHGYSDLSYNKSSNG